MKSGVVGMSIGSKARKGALLLCLTCASVGAAEAQVFEIADDGAVLTRSGGGAVRWTGGEPGRSEEGETVESDIDVPGAAVTRYEQLAVPPVYLAAVQRIAIAHDIAPVLLASLVWQESRWQPAAVSKAGALGLAQLMPATARSLGVDPRDPIANLEGGARFLRTQLDLFDGNVEKALAAYNAGPARVLRAGGIPAIPETRAYVAAIVGRLAGALQTTKEPVQ